MNAICMCVFVCEEKQLGKLSFPLQCKYITNQQAFCSPLLLVFFEVYSWRSLCPATFVAELATIAISRWKCTLSLRKLEWLLRGWSSLCRHMYQVQTGSPSTDHFRIAVNRQMLFGSPLQLNHIIQPTPPSCCPPMSCRLWKRWEYELSLVVYFCLAIMYECILTPLTLQMVATDENPPQNTPDNNTGTFGKLKQTLSTSLLTAQDKGSFYMLI